MQGDMKQILPYQLWLGHAGDGRDFRQILDIGITAVIQLAEEEPALKPPRDFIYCRFPLQDGPGNSVETLCLAIDTVANLLTRQVPTLICCGAGMSRSPAVAAAAMARVQNVPPVECLKHVVACHPSDVSPGLWGEITRLMSLLDSQQAVTKHEDL
jgi:hypothetical protein